jgi:NadR type nicotinamide-nucleotide adenylyltransferase
MKVAIIGPESTGKTTLAQQLAQQFKGTYVPEHAREYIERKGTRDVTYDELCEIAKYQIEQLDSIVNQSSNRQSSNRQYFFDTELIVTKIWFEYTFGRVPEWLNEAILRYPMDLYLLTAPDIAWQPDPARYNGSDAIRQELFDRYETEIQALNIPYYIITHE